MLRWFLSTLFGVNKLYELFLRDLLIFICNDLLKLHFRHFLCIDWTQRDDGLFFRLLLLRSFVELLKLSNGHNLELGCIGMLLFQLLRGHLLLWFFLLFMSRWLLLFLIGDCMCELRDGYLLGDGCIYYLCELQPWYL